MDALARRGRRRTRPRRGPASGPDGPALDELAAPPRADAAHRIARRVRAGTVWVDTYDAAAMTTPFGGMGASGHGRDRSLDALAHYAHLKTTWVRL